MSLKTIKRFLKIAAIITTLISAVSLIIWIIFVLNELDLIDLGGSTTDSGSSSINSTITDAEVKDLLAMSEQEVWQGLTGGLLSARPSETLPANANEITAAVESQLETITVPTWAWEDEGDPNNFNKVTKERSLQVNKFLAKLWTAFFTDLYNTDKNFVIAEGYLGGYRVDGTGVGQIGYKSAHTYGAAIDINWYEAGNPYGSQQPYTKEEWDNLPENHVKYQTIYIDSPIVQIAHKYTLLWGGEWNGTTKDIMHFSFVCDGKTREERIQLFAN